MNSTGSSEQRVDMGLQPPVFKTRQLLYEKIVTGNHLEYYFVVFCIILFYFYYFILFCIIILYYFVVFSYFPIFFRLPEPNR